MKNTGLQMLTDNLNYATVKQRHAWERVLFGVIWVGIVFWVSFSYLHFYNSPMDHDLSIYAVGAHEMLNGRPLYSEVWDVKPPGIWVTFALTELLVGYGPQMIYFQAVTMTLLIIIGIYKCCIAVTGNRVGGILASLYWAAVACDVQMALNEPNTEFYINACIVWSFALLLRIDMKRMISLNVVGVGFLWLLASFYKHSIVVWFVPLTLAWLIGSLCVNRWKVAVVQTLVWLGIGVVGWGGLLGYFAITGRGELVYITWFLWAIDWVGNPIDNIWNYISKGAIYKVLTYFSVIKYLAIPFMSFILAGLIYGNRIKWLLIVALMTGAFLCVFSHNTLYLHRVQFILPPALIAIGSGLGMLINWLPRKTGWGVVLLILMGIGIVGWNVLEQRFIPASVLRAQISPLRLEEYKLAHHLKYMLEPDERFFHWGKEMGLYFFSNHRPVTAVLYVNALHEGILKEELNARVMQDLKKAKPRIVVVTKELQMAYPQDNINLWLQKNYVLLYPSQRYKFFKVYVRKFSPQSVKVKQ